MAISFLSPYAIKVDQPFGEFFITKIKASDLLKISFSDPLRFIDESGHQIGSQRIIKEPRLKEIAEYIQTVEAAFPNSIILAANYDQKGFVCKDSKLRWRLKDTSNENVYKLIIPTSEKLASIVDGQHRLKAFEFVPEKYQDMELLCSIYFDLPNPYQAFIFATINFNQKKVDKSLAYEQFGFDIEDQPAESWSPDKLAVFLTRKLNFDLKESSPFYNHIILAPQNDTIIFNKKPKELKWAVSTATVVDGILRLITSNPKKDKNALHKYDIKKRVRKILETDKSPLRGLYLEVNDLLIYKAIKNYFSVVDKLLFQTANELSYIFRTVGIQALFDVLREILLKELNKRDISEKFFESKIKPFEKVNFADNFFSPSGAGRVRIRNLFYYKLGYRTKNKIRKDYLSAFERLLK